MSGPRHIRRDRRIIPLITAALVTAAGIGLGATMSTAHAADANLAANPGFESGLSGWTCTAGSGSVVSSPVHSGTSALKGTPSSSDDSQCSQVVSVQPNSAYTLSAYVEGSYVYLGATGTGGTDPSVWTPSATSYQQLSTTFTTGASTTSVTVYLHGWYGQPSYLADDVSLTGPAGSGGGTPPPTSPPPTSPPPGNTGLPAHAVTGYWQDFCNGATVQKLSDVNRPVRHHRGGLRQRHHHTRRASTSASTPA